MKIDRSKPRHWLLLLKQGFYTLLAITIRPFCKKPNKPLVLLYGHQFCGNLKALYWEWKNNFHEELDLGFLTLDPVQTEILKATGVEVLRCDRLRDMMALTRTAAMITDHGLHAMQPLVSLTNIRFIDVWHGIPFKGFTPDDFRLQHRYDEVWVSSTDLKKIYEEKFGFEPNRVKALGYARTDQLFNPPAKYPDSIQIGPATDTKVVLYAPTWQQDQAGRELFPFGQEADAFIGRLAAACEANGAVLAVRSHLNSQIKQAGHPTVRFFPQRDYPDTESLLLQTDLLICDWSSIAFDYLALSRPTLFLDVPPPFKNGFSLDDSHRFGQIIASMDDLDAALEEYLVQPEMFRERYGAALKREISFAYGACADGSSCRRQLQRMLSLVN